MLRKDFQELTGPVVLSLSGGMDSTVLLAELLQTLKKEEVFPIAFDYGQKHSRELESAKIIALYYDLPLRIFTFRNFATIAPSSQTVESWKVPEGHYEDGSMKQTVVPNRNSVLLNLAAAFAISHGAAAVAYAAHAGDHAVYPDCRPIFAERIADLFQVVDYAVLDLFAPYIDISKREIARAGKSIGVPFQFTWSCYNGREKHCGKCGTCVERKEALEGFDPTEYEL